MDKISRSQHDCEIQRIQTLLSATDPVTDEYEKMLKRLDILVKAANEDDRIQLEAEVEDLKAQNESERIEASKAERKKEFLVQLATPAIAGIVTIGVNILIIIANAKSQERAHIFESGGNSYTSRSDKFKIREPAKKLM